MLVNRMKAISLCTAEPSPLLLGKSSTRERPVLIFISRRTRVMSTLQGSLESAACALCSKRIVLPGQVECGRPVVASGMSFWIDWSQAVVNSNLLSAKRTAMASARTHPPVQE
jgi:hypothetical protein